MPSLEIHREGSRKVYEILDQEFSVGSGADSEILVRGDGVAARHARFTARADGRIRVEGNAGELEINGDRHAARVLEHGDLIRIGPVVLVFLEDGEPRPIIPKKLLRPPPRAAAEPPRVAEPEPAPSKPSGVVIEPIRSVPMRSQPKTAEERFHPRRASSSSGGVPRWAVMSLALLGGLAIVLITVRVLTATSGREPADLLNLAEHKVKLGELAMAQAYVDQAEQGDPDAAERARIREIRGLIDTVAQSKAVARDIALATRAFDARIQRFHQAYLDGKPPRREAAREFVRMVDDWLADYRDECEVTPDGQALVTRVVELGSRYRPMAKLDEPDNATDVLFRAGRLTRRRERSDFPAAIAALDEWLRANPSDAAVERVREQREQWQRESKTWFQDQCTIMDRLVANGHREEAVEKMRYIVENTAMPAWAPAARAKLAALQGP